MDKMDKIDLIKIAIPMAVEIIPRIANMDGFVHKRTTAEINGVRGFLIWDYIIYNEITFQDMDGKSYSFFSSMSSKETEKQWDELVKKYGV